MATRRGFAVRAGAVGVVLLVVGVALWAVSRLVAGTEPHSYAEGLAPTSVQLAAGHRYTLAVRGGVPAEDQLGVTPSTLTCSVSSPRIGLRSVRVTAETSDTKAINQIGSFIAPVTGRMHVHCLGLGAVFVDDAADAPADSAGLALLLATAALVLGAPLTLSAVRDSLRRRASEQQQVE